MKVKKYKGIIPLDVRRRISNRYKTITKAINREFWNIDSETQHSFYVGSYGRGTAIDTSDIDLLVELPQVKYEQTDSIKGNGQSRLLQAVKVAIKSSYPTSDVRADGQVVKISFTDGIKFEVLPTFRIVNYYSDEKYIYPDSNMGGNWRSTNPKKEQKAMREKNIITNGLLFDTCKHFRIIRDTKFKSYYLSGIVIDSFVYNAMGYWRWLNTGESASPTEHRYEEVLLNYYNDRSSYGYNSLTLEAPGSGDLIDTEKSMECLRKVLEYINK